MTILISHRFSTVRMADEIVVLDGGRIVERGNHEALMQQRRCLCAAVCPAGQRLSLAAGCRLQAETIAVGDDPPQHLLQRDELFLREAGEACVVHRWPGGAESASSVRGPGR